MLRVCAHLQNLSFLRDKRISINLILNAINTVCELVFGVCVRCDWCGCWVGLFAWCNCIGFVSVSMIWIARMGIFTARRIIKIIIIIISNSGMCVFCVCLCVFESAFVRRLSRVPPGVDCSCVVCMGRVSVVECVSVSISKSYV